jgi:hypothetical protein
VDKWRLWTHGDEIGEIGGAPMELYADGRQTGMRHAGWYVIVSFLSVCPQLFALN